MLDKRAITYLRVSGESQILTDGFPRQREACLKYAAEKGIEIVAEFRDEGVTGKMELENREGLSACIAYCQEHNIKLAIVEDSTRLARDLIVAEICIREFQRLGVHVISASGGVDLTEGNDLNPTAKLIRQILGAVSEWERCVITLKLKGARQRQKIKNGIAQGYSPEEAAIHGKCEGRVAFGFKPGEERILEEMRMSRDHGLTCEQIAYSMNELGVPTRTGKGKWRGSVISKILARDKKHPAPAVSA